MRAAAETAPAAAPDCPLCRAADETVLWRDVFCRVIWVDDPDYPGFCRVILNAHVKEMTDLPPSARQRLLDVVWAVETALRERLRPDKINLASLGNVVPHLHWHVIPRFAADRHFPDPIWAAVRRPAPAVRMEIAAERQALAERLRALLAAA
mgnify:CR=1 FL=1